MAKRKISADSLDNSVTHLLQRAVRLALDFHAQAAGTGGATQRQFTVLAATAVADGQNQNDLVRATGIDRSTLAELVSRMLARGLLERERSATDARANTVRLSQSGQAALFKGKAAAAEADQRLLSLLAPKKRESLMKILASLAAAGDGGVNPEKKPAKGRKKRRKKKAKAAALAHDAAAQKDG